MTRCLITVACLTAPGLLAACSTSGATGPCKMADSTSDAGLHACTFGRAFYDCETSQGGSLCVTDGDGCGNSSGCVDQCASNEYAVACGGPPLMDGSTYGDPPAGCRFKAANPGGGSYYCCTCL
jgi:hypothetical protein